MRDWDIEGYGRLQERGTEKPEKIRHYFGDAKTAVSLEEIACAKIREEISAHAKGIEAFVQIANKLLPEGAKLDLEKASFDIIRAYKENGMYEDDGNTGCEGFEYSAYWVFPIGVPRDRSFGASNPNWAARNSLAETSLYFAYFEEERVRDHQPGGNSSFSVYLAGVERPGKHSSERIERIDYGAGALGEKSLAQTIVKIRETHQEMDTLAQIRALVG